MIELWRERYDKIASEPPKLDFSVLTAFNANLDKKINFKGLDFEQDSGSEDLKKVEDLEDLKKVVKFCRDTGSNREVDSSRFDEEIGDTETSVGGQAGIMANYLSNMDGEVIFYTPLLSEKLAGLINEDVKHPYFDRDFELRAVKDAANTDRTKENTIIEFSEGKSSRLILSDSLKGFGPYFRTSIEENIDKIDQKIDRALFSGFHNVTGNKIAKIEKARRQIAKIESKKHLELVDCDKEGFRLILDLLGPEIDSLGLDETELQKISELLELETSSKIGAVKAFEIIQKLMESYGIERVHLHTYRYHLLVADKNYSIGLEDLRDGMVFGEVSAILCAENGRLPLLKDFEGLDFERMHVKNLDALEEFEASFDLDNFAEKGFAEVSEYKVAAIPTLIHENPERLVGMGDIISSGSHAYEISRET